MKWMTLEEWINTFTSAVNEIERMAPNLMLATGNKAAGMIKERIEKTGRKADGSKFHSPNNPSGYSNIPMLVNASGMTRSAYHKVAGSKKQRKELKWVTVKRHGKNVRLFELKGGYEQFRDLHGRPTSHVNFSFTGKLWSNVQVTEHDNKGCIVTAKNSEEHKKLEGLSARFGNLLELSENEQKELVAFQSKEVMKVFQKYGLL